MTKSQIELTKQLTAAIHGAVVDADSSLRYIKENQRELKKAKARSIDCKLPKTKREGFIREVGYLKQRIERWNSDHPTVCVPQDSDIAALAKLVCDCLPSRLKGHESLNAYCYGKPSIFTRIWNWLRGKRNW
jgi:hypothetical protein